MKHYGTFLHRKQLFVDGLMNLNAVIQAPMNISPSHYGHSIEASTPKITNKIHHIVLEDRKVKMRELAS